VFAQEKYAGNHLAGVRHGRQSSDGEMQRIARDIEPCGFVLDDEPGPAGDPARRPSRPSHLQASRFAEGKPIRGT
jgi:hypothetical protein